MAPSTPAVRAPSRAAYAAPVHAQPGSRLMSAPAEIRRAVYGHLVPPSLHVFFPPGGGRLAGSVCLEPPVRPSLVEDYFLDGYERRPPPGRAPACDDAAEATWARRVASSWGPHWKCEEAPRAPDRVRVGNLLSVCKIMFFDLCDIVVESAVVNVTDLEVLEVLTREPLGGAARPGNFWDWVAGPLIQRLHVTLRLPLAFYEALERGADDEPASTPQYRSGEGTDVARAIWASVWPAVCRLPKLRHLHIWLDHDEASSWSVVRERRVLGDGLMAVLAANLEARARAGNSPPVDVLFNLPKLHPALARPDTHFVAGSPPSPFTIDRRFRLRYYCEERADGTLRVTGAADFPITKVLVELVEIHDGRNMNEQDIRQVESTEERLWEQGADVDAYLQDVINEHQINRHIWY